ncbi:MAG: M24 family metallopeptidase [Syntrophales bacterium LBB04]|nr:M24 family metallopeptidase [Syntrophales bacterium LBB04]
MNEDRPVLSLKERDRRWRRVREVMKKTKIECLIVAGLSGREVADAYLTNEGGRGTVIVPIQGDGTYLASNALSLAGHVENLLRGGTSWIDDWRVGASARQVVAALQEKGFDSATIGVIGLESEGPGEMEGYIPFKTWSYIRDHLPKVTFVDISSDYYELMLTRSEEEIRLARYSAQVGEMACEAMLEATRPGVRESEIYAAVLNAIHKNGCDARMLILESGAANISWLTPMWLHQSGTPRAVQKGEMVQAEIFTSYGGIETQQQMSIGLEPVDPMYGELARIARRSYEVGLKELKPGKRFEEVAEAMERPLAEAGCWHLCPLIHSLSPQMCAGRIQLGMTGLPGMDKYGKIPEIPIRRGELVLKSGMLFELEPNPGRGRQRVVVGGTVLITESGAEELNNLCTDMRTID